MLVEEDETVGALGTVGLGIAGVGASGAALRTGSRGVLSLGGLGTFELLVPPDDEVDEVLELPHQPLLLELDEPHELFGLHHEDELLLESSGSFCS